MHKYHHIFNEGDDENKVVIKYREVKMTGIYSKQTAWYVYKWHPVVCAPGSMIHTKYAANCAILSFGGFGLPRLRLLAWPRPRVTTGFEATARCFSTSAAKTGVQNTQPDISVASLGSLLLSWNKKKKNTRAHKRAEFLSNSIASRHRKYRKHKLF